MTTRLDVALNESAMASAFQRHVACGARVTACRVVRQRHRPGQRRLVQYAVSVAHAETADEELRVTGQWHAEPGHMTELVAKLGRRSRAAASAWTAALPPVFHDVATGMLATTYPWDRRLPALVDIASGRTPRLLRPMAEWMGVDRSSITRCTVETVRYREQLSAVCRYTLDARREGHLRQATFYVKAYGDDQGAEAIARLGWLARATPAGAGSARVQRAVAYDRGLRALVLAAAPGTSLDVLSPDDPRLVATLEGVARALATFSRRAVPVHASLRHVDRAAAATRSAAAIIEGLPAEAARVSTLVARANRRRGEGPARIVHGDLKLEHVFVDVDVWLVDLDSCHQGDALWDLALLQARWWAAHDAEGRHHLAHAGRAVLAEAYLAQSDPDASRRLPALTAYANLDVAAGLAKRQEPDWRARVRRLLDDADAALEAGA